MAQEILDNIVKIYNQIFGMRKFGGDQDQIKLKEVQEQLEKIHHSQWRLGSRFTINSKLYIHEAYPLFRFKMISKCKLPDDLIYFDFDLNFGGSKTEREVFCSEAAILSKRFSCKVARYLQEKKVLQLIKQKYIKEWYLRKLG